MKKQNDLQWFLIKKFIEILAVVGVVEYLLTFLVNRFVLPNVLLYFFPGVEENPLLLGSGVIFFLSAVLMLLILGALNAMFPSMTRILRWSRLFWAEESSGRNGLKHRH